MTTPSLTIADKAAQAYGGPMQGASLSDLAYNSNNVTNSQSAMLVDHAVAGDRSLGTPYIAGIYKRIVIISVKLTSAVLTASTLSFQTTIKGILTPVTQVAGVSGIISTIWVPFTFHVDPNGSYIVSATGSITPTISAWVEIDG